MANPNDPNFQRTPNRGTDRRDDKNTIIWGCIAAALVLGGYYAFSHNGTNVRSADNNITRSTPSSNSAPAPVAPSTPSNPANKAPNR